MQPALHRSGAARRRLNRGTKFGTKPGTMGCMPALNVTFTDEEMEQLRAAAANGDVSLRAFIHRAALDAASDHKRRVREGARMVAERSAELNRRLA